MERDSACACVASARRRSAWDGEVAAARACCCARTQRTVSSFAAAIAAATRGRGGSAGILSSQWGLRAHFGHERSRGCGVREGAREQAGGEREGGESDGLELHDGCGREAREVQMKCEAVGVCC